jgi:hypothetical protein
VSGSGRRESGAELWCGLAVLAEEPDPGHRPVLDAFGLGRGPTAAEHADLFALQLFPWASVYLGDEGQRGGEARDRIAGFWRALGARPPEDCDHLVVLLAAYADLVGREGERRAEHAREAFFWEHLASWLPAYLARVAELGSAPYRRWARLAADALAAEARALGEAEPGEPAALREVGPLADPRAEGADPFVASLLAPARSGMIVVRDDLLRAGRELALGVRAGERRWVLSALLGQRPSAVLRWLAEEAGRQAALWREAFPRGASREHWTSHASATAALLAALAGESDEPAT